ncbi:CIC11C00000000263 [Sungouiella intermedia]|uniref:CIC11C00000000263 n=1 Tax=Sungouiella intermedia TaxID=45354 RepID=A0A1L0BA19_9ASCO|nr:CIC11C00000000263 [[Candida] intermedia]
MPESPCLPLEPSVNIHVDPIVLIAKHEIFAISDQLGSTNAFIFVSIAPLYVVLSREQSPS